MTAKTPKTDFAAFLASIENDPLIKDSVCDMVDLHSHIGIDGKRETITPSRKGGSWEDWCDVVFSGEPNKGKRNA